jgi:hypothetical protein
MAGEATAAREPRVRGIEPLEGRIAPASLLDARTVAFVDLDGDTVHVRFSKAIFDVSGDETTWIARNNLENVFIFAQLDGENLVPSTFGFSGGQQLRMLDLTKVVDPAPLDFKSPVEGASVSITVFERAATQSDGAAHVGAIKATDIALGRVQVQGDLGQIDAGRDEKAVGIEALVVDSLHGFGTATQGPGTAAEQIESKIIGALGLLHVKGDMRGYIHVVDGTFLAGNDFKTNPGKISKVIIEGSIIGNPAAGMASDNSGLIQSQRSIGPVSILGKANPAVEGDQAGLVGGGGRNSGAIIAGTSLGPVFIADSIHGAGGQSSGSITAASGVKSITIDGDLIGGAGMNSGRIVLPSLGKLAIGGDLKGGGMSGAGSVQIDGRLGQLIIGEDIEGGTGFATGNVSVAGVLGKARIGGDVLGSSAAFSGAIESFARMGSVVVEGEIKGGTGERSGAILSSGSISKISAERLTGGSGAGSGSIFAGLDPELAGAISSLSVGQGLTGGAGQSSGAVLAAGIGAATIGTKSLAAQITGGTGNFSGALLSSEDIGKVQLWGGLAGGTGIGAGGISAGVGGDLGSVKTIRIVGEVSAEGESATAKITATGKLGTVRIDGAVADARIGAGQDIGTLIVGGSLSSSTVSAVGQAKVKGKVDVAIGSVQIRGSVAESKILAGYDVTSIGGLEPVNGSASIGSIRVDGGWTASSVAAGVVDALADGFGNGDDVTIVDSGGSGRVSQIASIVIQGAIAGTDAEGDHFGFTAARLLAFQAGGTKLPLNKLADGQSFALGSTGDVAAREVPPAVPA